MNYTKLGKAYLEEETKIEYYAMRPSSGPASMSPSSGPASMSPSSGPAFMSPSSGPAINFMAYNVNNPLIIRNNGHVHVVYTVSGVFQVLNNTNKPINYLIVGGGGAGGKNGNGGNGGNIEFGKFDYDVNKPYLVNIGEGGTPNPQDDPDRTTTSINFGNMVLLSVKGGKGGDNDDSNSNFNRGGRPGLVNGNLPSMHPSMQPKGHGNGGDGGDGYTWKNDRTYGGGGAGGPMNKDGSSGMRGEGGGGGRMGNMLVRDGADNTGGGGAGAATGPNASGSPHGQGGQQGGGQQGQQDENRPGRGGSGICIFSWQE